MSLPLLRTRSVAPILMPLLCWLIPAIHAQSSNFGIIPSPSPNLHGNTLNALAAVSTNSLWAVGFQNDNQLNGSRTLTEHWDGRQWTVVPSPNPGSPPSCDGQNSGNMLNAAAAAGPGDVWAVGFQFSCRTLLQPLILHWNGSAWVKVQSPPLLTNDNSALNGIQAFSSSNIYAVGYQPAPNGAVRSLVEHWDGTAWSVMPSANGNATGSPLNAVSGTAPTDIWAVGDLVAPNRAVLTLTEHFDGTQWTVVPSPSPVRGSDLDQNVLTAVYAAASNDVTAVGFTLNLATQTELTLIEHWDGARWSAVPSRNQSTAIGSLNTLTGVSGSSGSDLYAVGYYEDAATGGQPQTLIEHFDGSVWTIVPSPAEGLAQHLNGVLAVPGATNVWTVGAFAINGDDPETGLLQVPQALVLLKP